MDFYEVLKSRRSCRNYLDRPIPPGALDRLAEAVHCAPSACNRQPWKFEIVFNPERRKTIAAHYAQPWLMQAPAIVVAYIDPVHCWKRFSGEPAATIDLGIAMEHLVLAAAAEGLGTCWVCAFDQSKLGDALGVKAPWMVGAISPLGYPAAAPAPQHYKPLNEIFEIVR